VRTCNRAAPSDRSATATAGCGSSNVPKKDRNASVSFRCDSGLIFASDDVEAGKRSGWYPRWARLTETVIGGYDWVFSVTELKYGWDIRDSCNENGVIIYGVHIVRTNSGGENNNTVWYSQYENIQEDICFEKNGDSNLKTSRR